MVRMSKDGFILKPLIHIRGSRQRQHRGIRAAGRCEPRPFIVGWYEPLKTKRSAHECMLFCSDLFRGIAVLTRRFIPSKSVTMKLYLALIVLITGAFPLRPLAQLNNGGLYAGFGVDADTRTNYMKDGSLTGSIGSDDWFAPSSSGYNVIDTTNSAVYSAMLKAGNNLAFSQRMSKLLYAKVGGKLWLDAAYGRDFSSAGSLKDSTVFTIAAKNGDNPNGWLGGISSTPAKNDLIDVYAHMRRDGITVYDSLWFFTGIAACGNAANSYYDVELYRNSFGYNSTTGIFTSAGTSAGHTEWLFDAAGNITQTGDLIVAVSFAPGSVPVIDVRIWVSQTTFNAYYGGGLAPKYFDFNGSFNSTNGVSGYASLVSKSGSTAFGAGIANYSATAANDSTYATPWGTSNSTTGWNANYQSAQFIEVGLNLTRIGVDPALYSTLDPCQSFFQIFSFAPGPRALSPQTCRTLSHRSHSCVRPSWTFPRRATHCAAIINMVRSN
jgi:hypothetical protein